MPQLPRSPSSCRNPWRHRHKVLDSFCRTMIKLSPWGGQFVRRWNLCSNFFRQLCLNLVSSPRALLLRFFPLTPLGLNKPWFWPTTATHNIRTWSQHKTDIWPPAESLQEHEVLFLRSRAGTDTFILQQFSLTAFKNFLPYTLFLSLETPLCPSAHPLFTWHQLIGQPELAQGAGFHLYSTLVGQLPTSPWGPSLPRGPGASHVPAFLMSEKQQRFSIGQ